MQAGLYILAVALLLMQSPLAYAEEEVGSVEAAESVKKNTTKKKVAAERFTLDPAHTYANFLISHLGFSVLHGRFNETEGELIFDPKGGESKVETVIQAVSIDTGHAERDAELQGEKWFNVAAHPTIRYQSESVTFIGNDKAQIEGRLTLLGVTKQVPLEVDRIECGVNPLNETYTCGFNARASLRRAEFGMTEALPMVGDTVSIRIQAEALLVAAENSEAEASEGAAEKDKPADEDTNQGGKAEKEEEPADFSVTKKTGAEEAADAKAAQSQTDNAGTDTAGESD